MRWKVKKIEYPKYGETRICSGFAFLSKEINDEVRQFEFVKWEEKYVEAVIFNDYWCKTRWID